MKQYDAFISYRHAELDKFAAENLHKKLEAFRLPKSIVKQRGKDCKKKIERVFRDRDELPLASNLADPIMEALKESEFLIVICSPRLPQSEWCKKEIETFISLHGQEKVLAVLVEGEPKESFPEALLYQECVVTKEDGRTETVKKPVEPLAADVRGKNKKEILKAMDAELLRLAAAMFGCNYDDLKQRHKEQKMRKLLTASLAASSIFLIFGAVSTTMAVRIRMQKEQIEKQAEEISEQKAQIEVQYQEALQNQSRSLAEKSLGILADGDRLSAIRTALTAFEDTPEGTPMPITAQAQYALTECSYVYQHGEKMMPYQNFAHDTNVIYMQTSNDGKYLLSTDQAGGVYVWETVSGHLLYRVQADALSNRSESECRFLTNELIAYKKDSGTELYDLTKEEVVFRLESVNHMLVPSADGKKFAIGRLDMFKGNTLTVYDTETFEEQITYTFEKGYAPGEKAAFEEGGNRLIFVKKPEMLSDKEGTSLLVMDLESGEITAEYQMPYSGVELLKTDGNCLYAGVNQTMDDRFPDKDYDYTSSLYSIVIKINLDTQDKEWQFEVSNGWVSDCLLTADEAAKHLLVVYYSDACMLNRDTGEVEDTFSFGEEVVNTIALSQTDNYALLGRSGEFHIINGEQLMDYSYGDYFSIGAANLSGFERVDTGYALLPYGSKNIVSYAKVLGAEGKEFLQADAMIAHASANAAGTRLLLSTYNDGEKVQMFLTDLKTQEKISEWKLEGAMTFIGFAGDGSKYFYAGNSDSMSLYDAKDGKLYKEYEMPEYFNYDEVMMSTDGQHLIFEDYDTFFILDLEKGTWEEYGVGVFDDVLTNNNRKTAIGRNLSLCARTDAATKAIQFLEWGKEDVVQQIPVPVTYVENMFFLAEDTELFVQYLDGSAQVFVIETGEVKAEFEAFEARIKEIQPLEEGYAFLGVGTGYLVNQNLEVTARIPGCQTVIAQRNEVITSNGKIAYVFPRYTTEGLVEAAEKVWESYQE